MRLSTFATLGLVVAGGTASADPRFATNGIVDTKHDCSSAVETKKPFESRGDCSDPPPAEVAAAVATRLTFDQGRAKLTVESRTALDPLVAALREHETLRLVIVGQFATGAGAQVDVARRRAQGVKWYLIDEGIAADRIDTRVSASKEPAKAIELRFDTLDGVVDRAPSLSAPKRDRSDRDASELASILTADADRHPVDGQRHPGANLGQLMEDARNQPATIGTIGSGFRDGGPSSVGIGPSTGLVSALPMVPVSQPKHEDDLGRASGALRAAVATSPAPEVLQVINARYLPGLDRCYRKHAGDEVRPSGRVGLSFGIDIAGGVIVPAVDVDRDLSECFRDQMKRWRLPVPRDAASANARFSITMVFRAK